METFISINELIDLAKKQGINFGKADPYNRLRYYTKIGWLPHMIRKTDELGNISGHYPMSTLNILVKIENLKKAGVSNEEIENQIKDMYTKNHVKSLLNTFNTHRSRYKIFIYILILVIVVAVLVELTVYKPLDVRRFLSNTSPQLTGERLVQTLDSGVSFIPKGSSQVVVKTRSATPATIITITFKENYLPATNYWITDIRNNESFTVQLNNPVEQDIPFYWATSN